MRSVLLALVLASCATARDAPVPSDAAAPDVPDVALEDASADVPDDAPAPTLRLVVDEEADTGCPDWAPLPTTPPDVVPSAGMTLLSATGFGGSSHEHAILPDGSLALLSGDGHVRRFDVDGTEVWNVDVTRAGSSHRLLYVTPEGTTLVLRRVDLLPVAITVVHEDGTLGPELDLGEWITGVLVGDRGRVHVLLASGVLFETCRAERILRTIHVEDELGMRVLQLPAIDRRGDLWLSVAGTQQVLRLRSDPGALSGTFVGEPAPTSDRTTWVRSAFEGRTLLADDLRAPATWSILEPDGTVTAAPRFSLAFDALGRLRAIEPTSPGRTTWRLYDPTGALILEDVRGEEEAVATETDDGGHLRFTLDGLEAVGPTGAHAWGEPLGDGTYLLRSLSINEGHRAWIVDGDPLAETVRLRHYAISSVPWRALRTP